MTWRAVAKEDEIEEGKILGLAEGIPAEPQSQWSVGECDECHSIGCPGLESSVAANGLASSESGARCAAIIRPG
jgi:hypothetical protein